MYEYFTCISITTASSSLSTEVLCFNMMLPVPKSPDDVNLIPSLDTPIEHVSPRTPKLIFLILFIKRFFFGWGGRGFEKI
jgi:hypothetical protein